MELYWALVGTLLILTLILKYINYRRGRALKEFQLKSGIALYGKPVPGSTCSDKGAPHNWVEVTLVFTDEGTEETHLACKECGVVFGKDIQFTGPGLDNVKAQLEAIKTNKSFFEELDSFRRTEFERVANSHGITMKQLLGCYDDLVKVELAAQEKLNARRKAQFEGFFKKLEENRQK